MEKTAALVALAALAQETRLDMFRLLVEEGAAGCSAGRIGERLGLPAATASFHLGHLRQAGLIRVRRAGRSRIYAAEYEAMNRLIDFLTTNCCHGDPRACGLAPSRLTVQP